MAKPRFKGRKVSKIDSEVAQSWNILQELFCSSSNLPIL